ncbi:hypothetical protein M6B38_406690 [Iris pallida]|uniref:Uncharacterized protein n=1 Tax=Iris pallida TaxID=29817 RepID=A0AAX6FQJ5_IRIPA|nr:hypothetical protein M6B38_406690 [Iris pallida]
MFHVLMLDTRLTRLSCAPLIVLYCIDCFTGIEKILSSV